MRINRPRNKLFWMNSTISITPGAWGLYYKKLRIRNLQKMDSFHSNIVSFLLLVTFTSLDKRTSLLRNP